MGSPKTKAMLFGDAVILRVGNATAVLEKEEYLKLQRAVQSPDMSILGGTGDLDDYVDLGERADV